MNPSLRERSRRDRLAIIILAKGGLNAKAIGSVLKMRKASVDRQTKIVRQYNRVPEPELFALHFTAVPQHQWRI